MARISTAKASVSWALGNMARPTPSISSAIRMDGNDSMTSHTRMMKASVLPPTKPDSRPRPTPSTTDSSTEAMPTSSEMRAPYISAERMSRPWSSVPNRYSLLPPSCQAGGSRASDNSSDARSNGLCGATTSANSAQNRHTAAMTAAAMAMGELRKLNQTSLSSARRHQEGAAAEAVLIWL